MHRTVKSFVRRQSKATPGQSRALKNSLTNFEIKYNQETIVLDDVFKRQSAKIIEIGFGMGHATWQIARENLDKDYLAIEVHSPGIGSLLINLEKYNLANVKIVQNDAVEVIKHMIQDNSISGFHVFFPDPWHKKRHHKRRIIQQNFIELLYTKLITNGYIHIATDWQDYALWIANIFNNFANFELSRASITRPKTKFEERGINLGHKIWDFLYLKKC